MRLNGRVKQRKLFTENCNYMDIFDFVTQYWSILAFIGIVIGSWFKYSQSLADMKVDMAKQKEDHDSRLNDLRASIVEHAAKLEAHKDKTNEVLSNIQQDVREIMTILKRDV